MLTKDLINLIAGATGKSKKETEHLLTTFNAIIRENLMAGKTVQLQSLGALETKTRSERIIVHPKTGERTVSPSKTQVVFKPVATIKEALKNS